MEKHGQIFALLSLFIIIILLYVVGYRTLEKRYGTYQNLSISCSYCYNKSDRYTGTVYVNTSNRTIGYFDENMQLKQYNISKAELYFYLFFFETPYKAQGEADSPYSEYVCIERLKNDDNSLLFFDYDKQSQDKAISHKHSCLIGNSRAVKALCAVIFFGLYLRTFYFYLFFAMALTVPFLKIAAKKSAVSFFNKRFLLVSLIMILLLLIVDKGFSCRVDYIREALNSFKISFNSLNAFDKVLYRLYLVHYEYLWDFKIANYILLIIGQSVLIYRQNKRKLPMLMYQIITIMLCCVLFLFYSRLMYVCRYEVSYKFLSAVMQKLYLMPTSNIHVRIFFGVVFFYISLLVYFITGVKSNKLWNNLTQSFYFASVITLTMFMPCFMPI